MLRTFMVWLMQLSATAAMAMTSATMLAVKTLLTVDGLFDPLMPNTPATSTITPWTAETVPPVMPLVASAVIDMTPRII